MAAASLSAGALLDGVGWLWTNLIALALLTPVVVGLVRSRVPRAVPSHSA